MKLATLLLVISAYTSTLYADVNPYNYASHSKKVISDLEIRLKEFTGPKTARLAGPILNAASFALSSYSSNYQFSLNYAVSDGRSFFYCQSNNLPVGPYLNRETRLCPSIYLSQSYFEEINKSSGRELIKFAYANVLSTNLKESILSNVGNTSYLRDIAISLIHLSTDRKSASFQISYIKARKAMRGPYNTDLFKCVVLASVEKTDRGVETILKGRPQCMYTTVRNGI